MVIQPEPGLIADLHQGLRGTFLDGRLILGGSSGLFGFPTRAPAFTEDLGFMITEDLVVARGGEIVHLLSNLGYRHEPETPTFAGAVGPSFDLVGFSTSDFTDHLSAPGPLRVMVFGDLGIILTDPASVIREPERIASLSPAGFAAVKLMTMRVEKGAKDKLQALLVISERTSDPVFRETLVRILGRFDPERRRDAVSDAQGAFLSLQRDPEFRDQGAEGYGAFMEGLESGYRALLDLAEEPRRG